MRPSSRFLSTLLAAALLAAQPLAAAPEPRAEWYAVPLAVDSRGQVNVLGGLHNTLVSPPMLGTPGVTVITRTIFKLRVKTSLTNNLRPPSRAKRPVKRPRRGR